jgi:hypothetical protein
MSLVKQAETYLAFENSPLFKSGFFTLEERAKNARDFAFKQAKRAGSREAATRLVKASRSPTTIESIFKREKARFESSFRLDNSDHILFNENIAVDVEPQKQITPHGQVGCSTVVQYREWADEWRVRTQVDATSGTVPDAQTGARITELLSNHGAKKIAESCEFMSLKKGGYKTFVTGTFDETTRKMIEAGETTIQREVSRSMDALQKMYQRGWTTSKGEKVEGVEPEYEYYTARNGEQKRKLLNGLSYCWVVEIPKNENGDNNPHVHMLLGWRIPRRLFADWSGRIERIWKNGYFHLEKIKDCLCAGAYMAKAAGYMTKGNGDDSQGQVRGNRYGISDSARAPDWVTIGKSQLHTMGQLIADVYDHLTIKHGSKYRARKQLKEQLDATPKTEKKTREEIGKKLQEVREQIKSIPVRCNKYQIILKGREAASAFIGWAKGEKIARDWLPDVVPKELAWSEGDMPTAKDSHFFRRLAKRLKVINRGFIDRKRMRLAAINTDEILAFFAERWEGFKNEAFGGWSEYETLDLCQ